MSIDRDLRATLTAPEPVDPVGVAEALATVKRRAARGETRRRAVGVSGAVGAVVAVAVLLGPGLGRSPSEPSPAPPPTATVTGTASAMDGTWLSGVVSDQQVRRVLRGAGLGEHADRVLDYLTGSPRRFLVVFADGTVTVSRTTHGSFEAIDTELVRVSGDRVTLSPRFDHQEWSTTYRWTVDDQERLHMELVGTTEGVVDGVPGEAWQRVVFTAAPFTRLG